MGTSALEEIAAHYNEKGNHAYVCVLYASKAFDKMNVIKLWPCLIALTEKKIPCIFLCTITDLYRPKS